KGAAGNCARGGGRHRGGCGTGDGKDAADSSRDRARLRARGPVWHRQRHDPARLRGPVPLKVVVLAGGTGGAKLAAGFGAVLPAGDLTVIANTGDDQEFWGLLVCPDTDAVIYRLAGVFDEQAGYGQKDETVRALD